MQPMGYDFSPNTNTRGVIRGISLSLCVCVYSLLLFPGFLIFPYQPHCMLKKKRQAQLYLERDGALMTVLPPLQYTSLVFFHISIVGLTHRRVSSPDHFLSNGMTCPALPRWSSARGELTKGNLLP